MRLSRTQKFLFPALLGFGMIAVAQDSEEPSTESPPPEPTVEIPTTPPVALNVARQRLKNFLVDETALAPYKKPDSTYHDLESVFTVGADGGQYAVFWDPVSCRLLGALDLKAPQQKADDPEDDDTSPSSPYTLLASGGYPFANSTGACGEPQYFGFRMLNGMPVFLYTHGSLVVEERLWLSETGDELNQLFTIRDPRSAVTLTLPAAWATQASAPVGEWKESVLSVPKENASQFVITYRLSPETTEPEESN